jgi:hypothetical protein
VTRRRPVDEPARIRFHKGGGPRYASTLHRPDGAVIRLEGGSWNRIGGPVGRVPHDLAHLVVEQELPRAGGVAGPDVALRGAAGPRGDADAGARVLEAGRDRALS